MRSLRRPGSSTSVLELRSMNKGGGNWVHESVAFLPRRERPLPLLQETN